MKQLTVRELYRKLNNNNEIPIIEGQGNFTADEMIWFAEQAVKNNAVLPHVRGSLHIDFAVYLTGHDKETIEQMYNDWRQ